MSTTTIARKKRARLSPEDFLQELHESTQDTTKNCAAIFVLQLNRSDRISALAQDAASLAVMKQAVGRIEPLLKASDFYAVVAHDELWILLRDLPSESIATLAAAGFREALRPVFTIQRSASVVRTVRMNPCVGVVILPPAQTDVLEVLHLMEESSVQARRSDARTCIQKVTEEGNLGRRAQLEAELRQALFANELEVYFQPQVSLDTGRCVSAEALIRWTRQNGKPVNAQVIATICEECGLMEQLTRFVLNNVLRLQMGLRAKGIDIKVAINLAAQTLADDTFPDLVMQAAQTWSVSPSSLVFEITEGSIVENESQAVGFMQKLRDLGCEISIDDFGTGYSSLSYLKKFPLSELKIDRSFVQGLGEDESSIKIVRVLTDLCKTFGLRCVAEGVETEVAQNILRKLGCDLGQGYLFARAMPTPDFTAWAVRFNQKKSEPQIQLGSRLALHR